MYIPPWESSPFSHIVSDSPPVFWESQLSPLPLSHRGGHTGSERRRHSLRATQPARGKQRTYLPSIPIALRLYRASFEEVRETQCTGR